MKTLHIFDSEILITVIIGTNSYVNRELDYNYTIIMMMPRTVMMMLVERC